MTTSRPPASSRPPSRKPTGGTPASGSASRGRREPGVVPHHRVTAKLHRSATRKAAKQKVSMSQVAVAGLTAYVADVPKSTVARYRQAADEEISLRPLVQTLPGDTREVLREMKTDRDPRMNAYLAALFASGWALSALAEPIGVTRQAIHLRIQTAERTLTEHEQNAMIRRLDIPEPPYFASGPGRDGDIEKVDWAVWVPRDLYTVAAKHARRVGAPMHDVMEGILRDFLDGELEV